MVPVKRSLAVSAWANEEMTAGNMGAAAAVRARMEEEKFIFTVKTLWVTVMLLLLTMFMSMYRMPGYPVPPFACLFFLFVTMEAQFFLALFLAAPAPLSPTLTRDRWVMGTLVWLFVSVYFMCYADMVAVHAPNPDSCELLVVAVVASAVNFIISLYIVLRRPNPFEED